MQTWAWCGSGAECYCGLWEKKGDFIPLSCPSIIAYSERKVLRLCFWRQRCCGWHLVTQGQWPAVPADCTLCCSPGVQHNASGAGWHQSGRQGCLKDVGVEGQGQQFGKLFHPGAFQTFTPAETGSTCRGNHSNFQCEAREETLHCEMWLSGLTAVCEEEDGMYQVLWGDKSSWFAAFGRPRLWMPTLWSPPHCQYFPVKSTTALWIYWLSLRNTAVFYWEVSKTYFGTFS